MEAEAKRSCLGGKEESVFFQHPIPAGVGKFLELETYAERYQYKLAAYGEGLLEQVPRNDAAITAVILLLAALAPAEILPVMSVDVRSIAFTWLDTRCQSKVAMKPAF